MITAAFVKVVALPIDVTSPVKFAFVITDPAVKPAAVPVTLVITPDAGVPRAGVTKVLLVKVSVPSKVASVPANGSVTVPDPAVAFAFRIVVPEVEPAITSLPTLPAAPKVFAPVML